MASSNWGPSLFVPMDKELIKQTATVLKENRKMAETVIDSYSKFIVNTISSGTLENVRIPMFGTFQVNMKKVIRMTQIEPLPKTKIIRRETSKTVPKNYKFGK